MPLFLDRRNERKALDDLLSAVHAGQSRALVIRGEAGVGKTALLDYLVGQAVDCRVLRICGVQPEMELAFAALHQLCLPLLDRVERLPEPQRAALRVAFGLATGAAPDRFLVGLAVLGLVAEAAAERPLVCVVDDAQWLDISSVEAITFAARRLDSESVAVALSVREHSEAFERLPELAVSGLPDRDARAILESTLRSPVDARLVDRVVAESRGNPLVLLELPRFLAGVETTGGFAPIVGSLPRRLEESYARELHSLPTSTQLLLLVAAADPLGNPVVLWRAVDRLGINADAAGAASDAGLLEIDSSVRFRHPMLRASIYQAASAADRREAHRALAEVTDPKTDPERRAWHYAKAAAGPDEMLAAMLERSSGLARKRGGLAAAAAFLEMSTDLTPEPAQRASRAIAAAQLRHQAGGHEAALKYVTIGEAGALDELTRAKTNALRAQIAFALNRGSEPPRLLLKAAKQLESVDPKLARETYLDALSAASFAGSLAPGAEAHDIAQAIRKGAWQRRPVRPSDRLLEGLAIRFTDGHAAAAPKLRRALYAFRSSAVSEEEEIRWLWLACTTAANMWDTDMWATLCARKVQLTRDVGALAALPLALDSNVGMEVTFGRLTTAAGLLEELNAVAEATGIHPLPLGALALAAWQGNEAEAAELAERMTGEALVRGEGAALAAAKHAQAVLYNSVSRYVDALAAAAEAQEHAAELAVAPGAALAELVEAATRSGHTDRAAEAVEQLSEVTQAVGTDWALGIEARSRALVSDDAAAEVFYGEAVNRLSKSGVHGECARAHLLYGEWLRRRNRRVEARTELRMGHEMFDAMNMVAFAERAGAELRATGEAVRTTSGRYSGNLTPQETQIARLVSEGLSNSEVAARLFISPRTVEWHLSGIFAKLQITSRRQLRRQ